MRTYRTDNLYFEFIQGTSLDGQLTANEAAACLESRGFIERLPDRYKTDRPLDFYRWKKTAKESRQAFKHRILSVLNACKDKQ